jgi:glycosyltransferase involved in cell wall biosynthesis
MPGTKTPLVTVCVPTIGRLEYIFQTLDSLKRQTLKNYELLILDNASEPAAAEKLRAYVATNPKARILRSDERLPMFRNFNRGIQEARGRYVTFFHDDDLYEPTFLERTTSMLNSHSRAAFAGSNYFVIDGDNNVGGIRRLIKRTHSQHGDDFIRDLVRRGRNTIPTPGIVFRKSAFDERGFDEAISIHFGDFIILMRMAEQHEAVLIADPLMRIRLHGQNASNVPMSKAAPLQYQLIHTYIDDFEKRTPGRRHFAVELRDLADAALRRSLLWGWISSDDPVEARRCLELFRSTGGTPMVASFAEWLDSIGFKASRGQAVAAFIRRLGRSVG